MAHSEETKAKIRKATLEHWEQVRLGLAAHKLPVHKHPLPLVRFWRRVSKEGPVLIAELGECWEWLGGLCDGYGQFTVNGRNGRAHRFIYQETNGPIPEGLLVCHKCDNRKCVRPSHLFLGTVLDNTRDMQAKGRGNYAVGEKHGLKKHPERSAKGERHGMSKLEVQDVLRLRSLHAQGWTPAQLSKLFGISWTQASRIALKERWRHV